MPGGNYGYHPRGAGQTHWHEEQPGVVPKILRTYFGCPTGMCVYEGTLLPKKYRGQLLHTDAGPRHVRCYHLKPKGAGYDVEREDMVTSTRQLVPAVSDVCVAPDGSVFVADWYDPGVGGHGMGDWTRGRIYRLTPKGHKGYKVPEGGSGQQGGHPGGARLAEPGGALHGDGEDCSRWSLRRRIDSSCKPAIEQKENPWLRPGRCGSVATHAKQRQRSAT